MGVRHLVRMAVLWIGRNVRIDSLFEMLVWTAFLMMVYFLFTAEHARAQENMETARLRWDAVTARENGDLLEPGELQFYIIKQYDEDGGLLAEHEVSADKTQHDIQVLANSCNQFEAYSAATPGPACNSKNYTMSRPSARVSNCPSDKTPNPPREFAL